MIVLWTPCELGQLGSLQPTCLPLHAISHGGHIQVHARRYALQGPLNQTWCTPIIQQALTVTELSLPTGVRRDTHDAGATSVPVPLNIQAEDIVTIVNEAELACLICSLDELGSLSRLVGGCPTVKTLVVMDLPSPLTSEAQVLMRKVGPPGCA